MCTSGLRSLTGNGRRPRWSREKVALVGARGGIGTELHKQLDAAGATVFPLDITTGFDATDVDQVTTWFGGHLDITMVIYAAGAADSARLTSPYGLGQLRRLHETNVLGAVTVATAARTPLRRSKGRFVVLNSAFSLVTADGFGAYSASKAALTAAVEALRFELAPATVTDCLLGGVRTPIFRRSSDASQRDAAGIVADRFQRRIARHSPADISRKILDAAYRRCSTIPVGVDAWAVAALHRLAPRCLQRLLGQAVGAYPTDSSDQIHSGSRSASHEHPGLPS